MCAQAELFLAPSLGKTLFAKRQGRRVAAGHGFVVESVSRLVDSACYRDVRNSEKCGDR